MYCSTRVLCVGLTTGADWVAYLAGELAVASSCSAATVGLSECCFCAPRFEGMLQFLSQITRTIVYFAFLLHAERIPKCCNSVKEKEAISLTKAQRSCGSSGGGHPGHQKNSSSGSAVTQAELLAGGGLMSSSACYPSGSQFATTPGVAGLDTLDSTIAAAWRESEDRNAVLGVSSSPYASQVGYRKFSRSF